MQGQPDVFFVTAHYEGAPYVLVRLEAVPRTQLAELLHDAWRLRAPTRLVAAWEAER